MTPFHTLVSLAVLAIAPIAHAEQPASLDDLDRAVKVDTDHGARRLARVAYEVPVDATPDEVWALLADYGAVHDYFPAIVDSDYVDDVPFGMDCARFCDIDFNGRAVHVKERIFAFDEGSEFTYDVYESENFPIDTMHVTFGVRVGDDGGTQVYNVIDYRLKPAMMTGLFRGRFRRSARSTVLGIKHVLETDERVSGDTLDALYSDL